MTGDPDWRITNQERYLMEASLVHRHYEPAGGNDHDHCPFCWAKFMVQDYPDVLHEGYATLDSSHWICAQCFHDFHQRFRWQLVPNAMAELAPEEVDLRGNWVVQADRSVVGDTTEQRIEWLTTKKLQRIANHSSGWDTLYRDLGDGRLWELTYPHSEMHGSGPRRLHVLSRDEVTAKYSQAAVTEQ